MIGKERHKNSQGDSYGDDDLREHTGGSTAEPIVAEAEEKIGQNVQNETYRKQRVMPDTRQGL